MSLTRLIHLLLVGLLGLQLLGCGKAVQRFDRNTVLAGLDEPDVGLLIGDFPLIKVIDGDTIRVDGLAASMRLLGLDTEETFKKKSEWAEFDKGWLVYLAEAQAKTKSPVKIPTPMGEEAKKFAAEFFRGVRTVHLERDHPKEIRDFYNRFLTYVFIDRGGKRINYNVECVRAGMSPYFSKYGYSRRYHDEFVQAQNEARAARRGIWDPGKQHYTDYDRRLEWWNRRGDYIQTFERDAAGRKNWVVLTNWDATDRLRGLLGREVVILGGVGEIRRSTTGGPTRVMLSRRRIGSFPLIFFDEQVLKDSRVESAKGEYIRARGVVASYKNKYTGREDLQIVVTIPAQVEIEPPAPEIELPATPALPGPEPEPEPAPPSPEPAPDPNATPIDPAAPPAPIEPGAPAEVAGPLAR